MSIAPGCFNCSGCKTLVSGTSRLRYHASTLAWTQSYQYVDASSLWLTAYKQPDPADWSRQAKHRGACLQSQMLRLHLSVYSYWDEKCFIHVISYWETMESTTCTYKGINQKGLQKRRRPGSHEHQQTPSFITKLLIFSGDSVFLLCHKTPQTGSSSF